MHRLAIDESKSNLHLEIDSFSIGTLADDVVHPKDDIVAEKG